MPDAPKPIQLVYHNPFDSIWHYQSAFLHGSIPWPAIIGSKCPICQRDADFRQISPYWRNAIDLFPWKADRIPIARFQCRRLCKTFSLLPHQLAPFHQYTLRSILGVIVLVAICKGDGRSRAAALASLVGDTNLEPFLLGSWLKAARQGFERCHHVLCERYDPNLLARAASQSDPYDVILAYAVILHAHDPPGGKSVDDIAAFVARRTGQPLLGILSQHRSRLG